MCFKARIVAYLINACNTQHSNRFPIKCQIITDDFLHGFFMWIYIFNILKLCAKKNCGLLFNHFVCWTHHKMLWIDFLPGDFNF